MELEDARAEGALKEAEQAPERAYAPYSHFNMGAAVVTERNAVVPGAPVENVSLGLAMCAEREAIFSIVAQDLGKPEILVLVAPRTSGELTCPCGACLQVAMELGGSELLVRDARIAWVFDEWQRVDAWIENQQLRKLSRK